MKIACIAASKIPSLTANSIQVMKACQALQKLGHSVTLIVPGEGRQPWTSLKDHYGLQVEFEVEWLKAAPSFRRYDFSLAAVRRARALGAELVYAWPPQAALFALVFNLPTILELHGEPVGTLGPLVFRLILKQAAPKRFMAISQALVDLIEQRFHYYFTPASMVIAPNGVDLERYQDLPSPLEARKALGLPEAFTAVHSGHLYSGRGTDLLFQLAKNCPDQEFLWVGGTPEAVAEWETKLQAADLQNVTLTGFVENARLPLYQAAGEVLMMPYERKIAGSSGGDSAAYASPMKMFEYMACGRIILSSDLPVIREVLSARNAILLPPNQTGIWEQALKWVRADPEKWQPLAAEAKRDVERHTWTERARRALEGFLASQA
jgi:glycosyltransferase involved in cell wall biosynthesis